MESPEYKMRLRSLHIVLILSFIGSGYDFISYMLTGLVHPLMKSTYYSGSLTLPSEMTVYFEQILETPRSFFFCGAILYCLSFIGVLFMWRLRKSGFHLYTLAQLLVLLITVLFLGRGALSLGSVMFTLLFVVYYYIALRNLGVFNKATEQQENSDNNSDNLTE
ncbi:MAG: hypothetical protein IKJ81_05090 [Bacteroidales bacterium]|jgi:hypothetical protein|nr:hypothetical protein [Bacteroidales bacterium]